MHDDDMYGTSVATIHDATAQGDLVPLMQGIKPDVAWVLQPPAGVSPGTLYVFRHGVTTSVLTRADASYSPDQEHDGSAWVSKLDTHTHGSIDAAQECIERNIVKYCQAGALVTSGPYVHVPPVQTSGHPLIDMLSQALGLPLPGVTTDQGTHSEEVPGFADLATLLREQGIDLDGSE